jgi:uncharacterized protein YndB with AHSA1/START domain
MPITVTVRVPADQATVWDLITDVARWPTWNPACETAEPAGDPIELGTRLRLHLRHPKGRLFWTVPVVSTVRYLELYAFTTRSFGFRAPTEIALTPDDEGTLVVLRSASTGPLAFSYRLMFPEKAQGQLWSGALTGLARHLSDGADGGSAD